MVMGCNLLAGGAPCLRRSAVFVMKLCAAHQDICPDLEQPINCNIEHIRNVTDTVLRDTNEENYKNIPKV